MPIARGLYRGRVPAITWGASYANTLTFAQPLDDAVCYSRDKVTAARACARNGEGDGYSFGSRGILTGRVRRIPRVDTGGVTGWEGASGWDAFLAWARDAQPFRFYPDAAGAPATYWDCALADDTDDDAEPEEETTRHRLVRLTLRRTDDLFFAGY